MTPRGNHDTDVIRPKAGFLLQIGSQPCGKMNLSLKRLFARSMTGGAELAHLPAPPPSTRAAVRRATFAPAAGILAIVGVVAAGVYFATRPVSLRIALGAPHREHLE